MINKFYFFMDMNIASGFLQCINYEKMLDLVVSKISKNQIWYNDSHFVLFICRQKVDAQLQLESLFTVPYSYVPFCQDFFSLFSRYVVYLYTKWKNTKAMMYRQGYGHYARRGNTREIMIVHLVRWDSTFIIIIQQVRIFICYRTYDILHI